MSWWVKFRNNLTNNVKKAVVNTAKEEASNQLVKILVRGSNGEVYKEEVSMLVKERMGILNLDNASLKRSVAELKQALQDLSMDYEVLKAENQQLKGMLQNPIQYTKEEIEEISKNIEELEEVF